VRYAICNELFAGWDLGRTCACVARAGYAGIELAPSTLAPAGVQALDDAARSAIGRQAADAGLAVVGLHWVLAGPPGLHLTSRDGAVRRRTSEYLLLLTDCCADLGGSVLVLGSPRQRTLEAGMDVPEGCRLAADCLAPAVERAADRGVRWCLEPLPRAETNFLNTLDAALALDALLGRGPALGVQLDVKSLSAESPEPTRPDLPIEAHAAHAGRFGHLHANDRNRRGPGTGDVAFDRLFAALRRVGYGGWASVEVLDRHGGDPEEIARESLRHLRRAEDSTGGAGDRGAG
jgi:sugar phosphate isomerase/epimerase